MARHEQGDRVGGAGPGHRPDRRRRADPGGHLGVGLRRPGRDAPQRLPDPGLERGPATSRGSSPPAASPRASACTAAVTWTRPAASRTSSACGSRPGPRRACRPTAASSAASAPGSMRTAQMPSGLTTTSTAPRAVSHDVPLQPPPGRPGGELRRAHPQPPPGLLVEAAGRAVAGLPHGVGDAARLRGAPRGRVRSAPRGRTAAASPRARRRRPGAAGGRCSGRPGPGRRRGRGRRRRPSPGRRRPPGRGRPRGASVVEAPVTGRSRRRSGRRHGRGCSLLDARPAPRRRASRSLPSSALAAPPSQPARSPACRLDGRAGGPSNELSPRLPARLPRIGPLVP